MSIYAPIDPALYEWAAENHLTVATRYRDEEVRSVDVVGPEGQEFQIWIEAELGRYQVKAARNTHGRRRRHHWSSDLVARDALTTQLNAALVEGRKWISESESSC